MIPVNFLIFSFPFLRSSDDDDDDDDDVLLTYGVSYLITTDGRAALSLTPSAEDLKMRDRERERDTLR